MGTPPLIIITISEIRVIEHSLCWPPSISRGVCDKKLISHKLCSRKQKSLVVNAAAVGSNKLIHWGGSEPNYVQFDMQPS